MKYFRFCPCNKPTDGYYTGMNNTNAKPIEVSETKTLATHFKGDARYGRTTTLIHKASGMMLGVYMGNNTRAECYAAYLRELAR